MKIFTFFLFLFINIVNMNAQEITVFLDPDLKNEIDQKWTDLLSNLDTNKTEYIHKSEPNTIWFQNGDFICSIRIVHSGEMESCEYELNKYKTDFKSFNSQIVNKLSHTEHELVFKLMLEGEWSDYMKFDPPKEFNEIKFYEILITETKDLDTLIEHLNENDE